MKAFVIMADIVDSSSYEGGRLMHDFKAIVAQVNKQYDDDIVSPLTITLGDEFQGIVKDLQSAVTIIFALDEALLNAELEFDLRYIVNYGEVETPINKEKAYEMLGEGLTSARKQLESMKSNGREVRVSGIAKKVEEKLNLALQLYRSLYDDWHTKDRKLVHEFLQNDDYKELARVHDKDPSSMWRKRRSLKIEDFKASKQLVELISNE